MTPSQAPPTDLLFTHLDLILPPLGACKSISVKCLDVAFLSNYNPCNYG